MFYNKQTREYVLREFKLCQGPCTVGGTTATKPAGPVAAKTRAAVCCGML